MGSSLISTRKAENETPGSNVSEVRATSTVVGTNSQAKVDSFCPFYKVLTLQIAYLMSAIPNQNLSKNHECNSFK